MNKTDKIKSIIDKYAFELHEFGKLHEHINTFEEFKEWCDKHKDNTTGIFFSKLYSELRLEITLGVNRYELVTCLGDKIFLPLNEEYETSGGSFWLLVNRKY